MSTSLDDDRPNLIRGGTIPDDDAFWFHRRSLTLPERHRSSTIGGEDYDWLYRSVSHIDQVRQDPLLRPANITVATDDRKADRVAPDVPVKRRLLHVHKRDLQSQGPGIVLYFVLIKYLTCLLVLLSVMKLPQIVISSAGDMLKQASIGRTMLGNLGSKPLYTAQEPEAIIDRLISREVFLDGVRSPATFWATTFGAMDGVCTIIIVIFMYWFWFKKTPSIIREGDFQGHSLTDHTVLITRLPPKLPDELHHHYGSELKEHLTRVLTDCGMTDVEITECTLVREDPLRLEKLIKCGQLKTQIALMEARNRNGAKANRHKLQKAGEELNKLEREIIEASSRERLRDRPVCLAFVSFEASKHKHVLVNRYISSRNWWFQSTQPSELRFFGESIRVTTAPEPSDILWENVFYPTKERMKGSLKIWILVLILLVIGLAMTWICQAAARPTSESPSTTASVWRMKVPLPVNRDWSVCEPQLYSDAACKIRLPASGWVVDGLVEADPDDSDTVECAPGQRKWRRQIKGGSFATNQVELSATFSVPVGVECLQVTQSLYDKLAGLPIYDFLSPGNTFADGSSRASPILIQVCEVITRLPFQLVCTTAQSFMFSDHRPNNSWSLATFAKRPTTFCGDAELEETQWNEGFYDLPSSRFYLHCYCLSRFRLHSFQPCQKYWWQWLREQLAFWATLSSVGLINFLTQRLVQHFVNKWERPFSKSDRLAVSLTKIFLAQYFNIGLSLLLTGVRIFRDPIYVHKRAITGLNIDFDAQWYDSVGYSLVKFAMFHIVFPRVFGLLMIPVWMVIRWWKGRRAVIQYDANRAYKRGDFRLDAKIGGILAYTSFTLTYSGPLPLILVCGVFGMTVAYWCDKLDFLAQASGTPYYNTSVTNTACGLLVFALIIRSMVSAHAFGHPLVSPSFYVGENEQPFYDLLAANANEEGVIMDYHYTPARYIVFSAGYLKHRWKEGISSLGALPSTLHLVFYCLFLINTVGLALAHAYTSSGICRIFVKIATYVQDKLSVGLTGLGSGGYSREKSYSELIETLKARGMITSYRISANPTYKTLDRVRVALFSASELSPDPEEEQRYPLSPIEEDEHPSTPRRLEEPHQIIAMTRLSPRSRDEEYTWWNEERMVSPGGRGPPRR